MHKDVDIPVYVKEEHKNPSESNIEHYAPNEFAYAPYFDYKEYYPPKSLSTSIMDKLQTSTTSPTFEKDKTSTTKVVLNAIKENQSCIRESPVLPNTSFKSTKLNVPQTRSFFLQHGKMLTIDKKEFRTMPCCRGRQCVGMTRAYELKYEPEIIQQYKLQSNQCTSGIIFRTYNSPAEEAILFKTGISPKKPLRCLPCILEALTIATVGMVCDGSLFKTDSTLQLVSHETECEGGFKESACILPSTKKEKYNLLSEPVLMMRDENMFIEFNETLKLWQLNIDRAVYKSVKYQKLQKPGLLPF